jgi:hypothetical protein
MKKSLFAILLVLFVSSGLLFAWGEDAPESGRLGSSLVTFGIGTYSFVMPVATVGYTLFLGNAVLGVNVSLDFLNSDFSNSIYMYLAEIMAGYKFDGGFYIKAGLGTLGITDFSNHINFITIPISGGYLVDLGRTGWVLDLGVDDRVMLGGFGVDGGNDVGAHFYLGCRF